MYLSDVGRTIPFGASEKTADFLKQVCLIKHEGLRKIASGKSGAQIREEVDQVIKEHGFESTHRPGHQIGLNVHEPYGPHLNFGEENSSRLKAGNVVTWEPGIGIDPKLPKNRFGMAHMEDMVLVGNYSRMLGDFEMQYLVADQLGGRAIGGFTLLPVSMWEVNHHKPNKSRSILW